MFRNQIDPQENDCVCYSESLDCLLSLAKDNLYYQQASPFWSELLLHWQRLSEKDRLEDDLENGLTVFRQELTKAEEYLSGPETLRLSQDDFLDIPAAFRIFDEMVCLAILLDDHRGGILKEITEEFKQDLKLLVLETTVDHLPPCHRFIPLNEWRCQILASIPERERYRFVWYDLWSGVPASSIGELIAHWRDIVDQQDRTWLEIPDAIASELMDAIKGDRLFYSSLQSFACRLEAGSEALVSSIPLGLMSLTNLMDMNISAPAIVMEKGYQAAACRVMTRPLHSEQERYERLFLAAFLGPDLSDQERIEYFKMLGAWINNKPKTSNGGLARCLQVWTANRLTGGTLIDQGFRHWAFCLEKAAMTMTDPVAYRAGAFHDSIKTLLGLPIVTIVTRVNEFIERLKARIPSVRLLPDMATTMESLISTAFPAPFALVNADGGEAYCQYICITETNQYLVDSLNVAIDKRSFADGLLTYDGVIDFDRDRPFPNQQACGLLTTDNEIHGAQYFSLDPKDYTFRGEFLVDKEINGQLRIILIHERRE